MTRVDGIPVTTPPLVPPNIKTHYHKHFFDSWIKMLNADNQIRYFQRTIMKQKYKIFVPLIGQ